MPSMTKVHPPVTGESFDITSLTRLADHPSLAPLFARRVGLNQRLATLAHAVQGLRQQLGGLPLDGGSFATATQRRTLEDRLSEHEREGAAIEEELRGLADEIAPVEDPLRAQVGIQ